MKLFGNTFQKVTLRITKGRGSLSKRVKYLPNALKTNDRVQHLQSDFILVRSSPSVNSNSKCVAFRATNDEETEKACAPSYRKHLSPTQDRQPLLQRSWI